MTNMDLCKEFEAFYSLLGVSNFTDLPSLNGLSLDMTFYSLLGVSASSYPRQVASKDVAISFLLPFGSFLLGVSSSKHCIQSHQQTPSFYSLLGVSMLFHR